jgi:hypothetical protein
MYGVAPRLREITKISLSSRAAGAPGVGVWKEGRRTERDPLPTTEKVRHRVAIGEEEQLESSPGVQRPVARFSGQIRRPRAPHFQFSIFNFQFSPTYQRTTETR